MELEKQAHIIDTIRETLAGYVGKTVRVHANMGRSKTVENEGILKQVHPQLFLVEVKRKRGTKATLSYQYVDVLTEMVQLYYEGEPIFGSFIEEATEEGPAEVAAETAIEAVD
jgi:uncharacterized protein Veg